MAKLRRASQLSQWQRYGWSSPKCIASRIRVSCSLSIVIRPFWFREVKGELHMRARLSEDKGVVGGCRWVGIRRVGPRKRGVEARLTHLRHRPSWLTAALGAHRPLTKQATSPATMKTRNVREISSLSTCWFICDPLWRLLLSPSIAGSVWRSGRNWSRSYRGPAQSCERPASLLVDTRSGNELQSRAKGVRG